MPTISTNFQKTDNVAGIFNRKRHPDSALIERTKRFKINEESSTSCGVIRPGYLSKKLGFSDDAIHQLRTDYTNNLILNHKKLHLVLDLDHTLLNTTNIDKMSTEEEYLKKQIECDRYSLQHVHIVEASGVKLLAKFRPFLRTFLVEASQMNELSIYTMGDHDYAQEMAKLLDPKGLIFGGRIISRSESTDAKRKALDVLRARESAIVILDDTKHVWQDHNQGSVIAMPRYHFFKSSCVEHGITSSYEQYGIKNGKPFSESKTDEFDQHGRPHLKNVLKFLRKVHTEFFDNVENEEDVINRDVRHVLKGLQEQLLKGCKIVFSCIWPAATTVNVENQPLWKLAEQLGATCSTQLDESVTHVVAATPTTPKSCWAVKEGKFLVNPKWIDTCLFLWQRQPENNFPCN